ncbi:MAG: hypothetical protein ACJAWW_000151 [Sulfurimonas sp.]|jgi:hypothetical protein
MRLKFLLLYSLLFSYSSVFASVPLTSLSSCSVSSGEKFTMSYNGNNFIATASIDSVHDINVDGQGLNATSTKKYISGNRIYCFNDTGAEGGLGDERYYFDYIAGSVVIQANCSASNLELDIETNTCVETLVIPTCTDNQTLNESTNTCECSDGFALNDTTCEADTDGDGTANSLDDDIDGDGILNGDDPDIDGDGISNELDDDIDGDGITNELDSDSNGDGSVDSDSEKDIVCKGEDTSISATVTGSIFSLSSYKYLGDSYKNDCIAYATANTSVWDGSFSYPDKNPDCGYVWCHVHETVNSCTYSASERKPNGYIYKSDIKSENECSALVDNITYTTFKYDIPSSLACPSTAYCFVKPVVEVEPDTNSEDEDDSMDDSVDLNTTSSDNQALLSALNTSNKHLSDLKDKVDLIDESLEKINETNADLLASSKDIKTNLDSTNETLTKSLSKQTLMNENLNDINTALKTANTYAKSTNSIALKNNTALNKVVSNTKAINDNLTNALYGGNPFDGKDLTDDGSSTFGDLQNQVSDSFSMTTEYNLFGLENISASSLQTYSVTMYGQTATFFKPSMLDDLPIDEIRALILFFSALAGFATIIRTV